MNVQISPPCLSVMKSQNTVVWGLNIEACTSKSLVGNITIATSKDELILLCVLATYYFMLSFICFAEALQRSGKRTVVSVPL